MQSSYSTVMYSVGMGLIGLVKLHVGCPYYKNSQKNFDMLNCHKYFAYRCLGVKL